MVDNNSQNIADVINKVKELEATFKAYLKENSDQIKGLSEIVHNVRHDSNKLSIPQPTANSRVSALISENEKRENGGITPPSKKRKLVTNQ